MSSLNGRVSKLERQANEARDATGRQFLILTEDLDDRSLFLGPDGFRIRRPSPEYNELEKQYQIILIVHADGGPWRPADGGSIAGSVDLDW